ncbi:MAG: b-brl protein [Ignavibacteria bacterium]|nr:b-brl protein [Ignavibacteria bacterium]
MKPIRFLYNATKAILLSVIILLFIDFIDAKAGSHIGFSFGLATPNAQINNVYNTDKLSAGGDSLGKLFREATDIGFNIGLKWRIPLDEKDNFVFGLGLALNRFPETKTEIKDQISGKVLATLFTTQNVIPIAASINYYLFKSFIGVYGTGELTYNFIANSVDFQKGDVPIPFAYDLNPTDSRVGVGFGAGLDIDLSILTINLETKYNIANMIRSDAKEETKAYLTLTLGVVF